MELKEFVEQTLCQIRAGVRSAQCKGPGNDRDINPKVANCNAQDNVRMTADNRLIETVEFDVAVTAEDTSGKKSGLGIFIAPLSAGMQGALEQKSITVSRVKFSVPIAYST